MNQSSSTVELRRALRSAMPVSKQYAYLDHAAVAPLPQKTAESIRRFLDQATHQGDLKWPEWSALVERTRKNAAALIGCHVSEIALVSNTTQGIGLIAEGFPWQAGDNVVVPENEFPSNLVPWRNLSRRGVELRLIPVDFEGAVRAEDLDQLIDSRTRIVSISWVGFSSGYRCLLTEIIELVHSRGALLFLDAIQGLGAFPLDVSTFPVDFVAADGHKWMLGPEGAGLLYIRQQHMERLQPLNVGWNSLSGTGFDSKSTELKSTAARYEGGSNNMMGMIGFGTSLDLLLELGSNQLNSLIQEAILENVDELEMSLREFGLVADLPAARENRSGIVGIRFSEDEECESRYHQARKYLLKQNVVVSVRNGKLRAATHAYNNSEDHLRLVEGLANFRRDDS